MGPFVFIRIPIFRKGGDERVGQTRAHPGGSTLILIIRPHALEDE